MQNLLPTNDQAFIMMIAKAIGRERLFHVTNVTVKDATGYGINDDPILLQRLESEFELLWKGTKPKDDDVRQRFYDDAVAAINAINLYLLTLD